jgi:hypothetical protein
MTKLKLGLAIAAGLLMTAPSWAESSSPAAVSSGTTQSPGFQALSPGEQKIARALFLAQHPTASGPAPLSLNQIAALKQHEGWGNVFQQMQTQGLIHAKNLGQVVSAHERSLHATAGEKGGTVVVTKGTGRSSIAGSVHDGKTSPGHGDADRATGEDAIHSTPADHGDAIAVANAAGSGRGAAIGEGSGHVGAAAHAQK